MLGNIFIHVPSDIQKLEDFGKGLEHYFANEEAFIKAINDSYKMSDDIINGRVSYTAQRRENRDTSTFYTIPCEFFNQQSHAFTPRELNEAFRQVNQKPFLLIFRYDDATRASMEFTSEIRSWYTEHLELRKYFPNDNEAMPNEPNRLWLIKFKDDVTGHFYSYKVNKSVLYQKVGTNSNAFAIVIFNAEPKIF